MSVGVLVGLVVLVVGMGWQAVPPLFICIVGTIRGFGMRKFFFEFWGRLAWCGAECGGEGVEG